MIGLQQFDRRKLEFLAVTLTFTFRVDLLDFFPHLTPPVVLSTLKSVCGIRVSSVCPFLIAHLEAEHCL